jgi:DNA primase
VNGPNAGTASSDGVKDRVLTATDIVELVGQSVALKRRGKDFVGLCPFHQEKTPSFKVDPTKQYFYCFGCKSGGNAIDFVIKRDRVEFKDALRTLAERAGIEMPTKFGVSREKTSERQQLLEACSSACALFEKLLSHPELGQAARNYLEQRGFDAESIRRFQVGFTPQSWDTLLRSPIAKKFPAGLLQQAGLVKSREGGGFYDTFRNRVMFPIRDEQGRVIAFGGRVMPGSEDPAKYLNSPETPLFSKSSCVYGLDLARQRIVETRLVAVVEGYTDVVMAHQFGVSNVVSILGTAMTEQHVKILRRFADRIVLLFDADEAGETAVNRAVELFMTQPVDFAVATMPDGTDPDEFLMQRGAEAFNKLLVEAPSVLHFLVRQFKRRWVANETNIPEQEKALAAFIQPFLRAREELAVDQNRWGTVIATVAKETGLPSAELHRRYGKVAARKNRPAPVETVSEPTNTAPVYRGPPTAQHLAERHILGVLLAEPSRWSDVQQSVGPSDFTDPTRRRLSELYWARQRDEGEPVFNQFLSELAEPALVELAVELVDEVQSLPSLDDALSAAVLHLAEARNRRNEQKLVARLHRTEDMQAGGDKNEDKDDDAALLGKLQESIRKSGVRRVGL